MILGGQRPERPTHGRPAPPVTAPAGHEKGFVQASADSSDDGAEES